MSAETKNKPLSLSRRDFLKITAAGAALGASAAGLSLRQKALAQHLEGQAESKEALEPLTIEVAGKSVSETDPENVWYYWRIDNPNNQALGYELQFLEEGKLDIPEADLAYLPKPEGVELSVRKDGSFSLRRTEAPCDSDRFSGHLSLVPAGGSVVVFFPPLMGGEQKSSVNIKRECDIENFWGYRPTGELTLREHQLVGDGKDLRLSVGATEELEGKAFAQIQVAFLNKAGEVIALRHTLAGETKRVSAGEETTVPVLNVDRIPFASYEVNLLGLTAP